MLDFVNINRTFACVAKRTFKKLIKAEFNLQMQQNSD